MRHLGGRIRWTWSYSHTVRDPGGPVDPAVSLPLSAQELQVLANCQAVQQAAEDFAAQNGGEYPRNVGADTTPGGDTLTDLLPSGILMMNPFTQANTEPIDGAAAVQGETGYTDVNDIGGVPVGYRITGIGEDGSFFIYEFIKQP